MKTKTLSGTLVILLLSFLALADSASTPPDDPFARYLYPPDRVMGHAMELGLDEAQKTSIKNEVQKAQGKFVDLQFELQGESEKMIRLLQQKPVDEAGVLAEVDRILALEKDIKKTQISLLVRIKNVLTPAQQAKLSEIPK
ncbi:MAG TPA: periplasmic heavy metal sensor [Thermoanaerobaculia bacterium]|jgi:Spy/CpxP family protein refolding chaperone